MINLSKRLQLVASFVPDNSNIIDVGCDHALLSIYLYQTKKNVDITASDINEKPLAFAKNNLIKYNLDKKIKLLKNDGIKNLDKKIDTIIISGMGGILISDILEKKYLTNVKNIIVSPNNEFPCVRKKIIKNGFYIEKEELVLDKNITYLVIKAKKGTSRKIDSFFGILKNNNLETIGYFTKILNTNTKILKKLPKKYILKRIKLKQENKKIIKFLNKK